MALRLVTTDQGIGKVIDGGVELLRTDYPDLGAALADGVQLPDLAASAVTREVSAGAVRLLAPVPRPRQFWAVGMNYAKHLAEINKESVTEPFVFAKAASAVIGPGQPIVIPRAAPDTIDFEGELAFVIGRETRSVSPRDAWSCVAGLTICNDVSERTLQIGGAGVRANISLAKSFDTFAPLGPTIALTDTVSSRNSLNLRTYVNGELRQQTTTDQLLFGIPELIAYLSARVTLRPGDIVTTGTPEGVGAVDGRYLKPGDEVRVELEEVGSLTNPVQAH